MKEKKLGDYTNKILEFYNQSVILRTLGNILQLDASISAIREKTNNKEQERMLSLIEFELNRLTKFSSILQDEILKVKEDCVDWEFIRSEEYLRLLFFSFEKIKIDYREDKMEYYARAILNYSTYEFSNEFYKEGIIEKISKYSVEHIVVINDIYLKRLEWVELTQGDRENYHGDIDIKEFSVKELEKEIVDLCIIDLVSDGFLREITVTLTNYTGGYYKITEYGLKLIKLLEERNLE